MLDVTDIDKAGSTLLSYATRDLVPQLPSHEGSFNSYQTSPPSLVGGRLIRPSGRIVQFELEVYNQ